MRKWQNKMLMAGLMLCLAGISYGQTGNATRSRTDPFAQSSGNELVMPQEGGEEDVLVEKKPTIDTTYFQHSPSKAMVFSAVLPGLGQAYNKKYWKIPIVYAALGGCAYWFWYSNDTFLDYRAGYISFMDQDPNTNHFRTMNLRGMDDAGNIVNAELVERELKTYKDVFDRNRSLAMLSLVFVYALNIIDASVDAHFFNFDVSEDITMRWDPVIMPASGIQTRSQYGLACKIKF